MNCKLSADARAAMIRHASAASPAECCGILLGRGGEIASAVPAANLADDPNRFLIDPRDHIAARRDGRTRGLEVVGFYHSHPRSAPIPSATDLAEAEYPELLHVIVGLGGGAAEVRAYRLTHGNFVEIPLVTET